MRDEWMDIQIEGGRVDSSYPPSPLPLSSLLTPHPSPLTPPPQGKEVATQIKVLPPGSVEFDTIGQEVFQGAVKTPVIRSFTHGRGKEPEPIPGEIIYQSDMDG